MTARATRINERCNMSGASCVASSQPVRRGERAAELEHHPAIFIGGKWQLSSDRRTFEVRDPSTDDCLAVLPRAGGSEAALAIDAAQQAFIDWSRRSVLDRADLLSRVGQLIVEYKEPLAQLTVLEQGMPLASSRAGVDYAASFFRWYAEEARRIYGRVIAHPDPSRRLFVEYVPRGVVGLITPWNAPLSSPAKKAAAAMAAGFGTRAGMAYRAGRIPSRCLQRGVRRRAGNWACVYAAPGRARDQFYRLRRNGSPALHAGRATDKTRHARTGWQRTLYRI
jgi:hypothetical protein